MWVKIGQGDDLSSPFSYSTNLIAIMENNTQKQKEQQHAVFKGILKALNILNGNLVTDGEDEGETVPAIGAVAESLDSIATSLGAISTNLEAVSTTLGTIAEKLDPLYMAEYTEPEEETPPAEPGDDVPGDDVPGDNDPGEQNEP